MTQKLGGRAVRPEQDLVNKAHTESFHNPRLRQSPIRFLESQTFRGKWVPMLIRCEPAEYDAVRLELGYVSVCLISTYQAKPIPAGARPPLDAFGRCLDRSAHLLLRMTIVIGKALFQFLLNA